MNDNYKKAMDLIKESNTIYIVTHVNPDGDAIGSSMAMYLTLKNMGKDVQIIIPRYADRFNFLEEIKEARDYGDKSEYDLIITLDASNKERLAMPEEDFIKAKHKIVIDHHVKTGMEADVSVLDNQSPATCQIIYEMLESQGIHIDSNIAKYIYLGILTDTGSFNYQRTTPRTHRIIANLLETGFDFAYICKMINDTIKENKLKLIAYAIDNIESFKDGKIKYVKIDWDIIDSFGVKEEEAEGITNYLRAIEGVEVAIYVRGLKDGSYKVSMRSNNSVDVSTVAMSFNGGGHARAAGFTVNGEIDKVKDEIIELVGVNL